MAVRWAIAGPGKIAGTVASEFALVPDADLVAVASRSSERAADFAGRHGLTPLGYDELWASDAVDAVYVATPHAHHTELCLAALAAGKHLLVEKSFTTSVADTRRVVAAARASGLFVMEAMWTRFLPAMVGLRELVADGAIGEVRTVQGDLTAFREFNPTDRLFDPAQGGGAVFDLGVYVLSFAQHLLGTPDRVLATGGALPNGVEGEAGILLGYDDGRFASLGIGFTSYGPGRVWVGGTGGWIDVPPRFHRMQRLVLHRAGADPEELHLPPVGLGYSHEIAAASADILAGRTESDVMPLDDTVAVQELMAEVLRQLPGGASS